MIDINDRRIIKRSIEAIKKLSSKLDNIKIMHLCGSHEHVICKYGIRDVLPENITVIPGPGCPVCVTTQKEIDTAIYLAEEGYTVVTLGDMYRVPGSRKSLMELQSEGADIRIVYGIGDAVRIAEKEGEKVVFIAIGFETTAPTTAAEVVNVRSRKIDNFYILNCHRQIPPVVEFLLEEGSNIQGFICPGHVATITGLKPYYKLCSRYKIPMIVAGFEPVDVLVSIVMILEQILNNSYKVENEYRRAVREEGNPIAQRLINEVFEPADMPWRGFPVIKNGGLKLRKKYRNLDIYYHEDIPEMKEVVNSNCICGEILRGKKLPTDCKLFGKYCTPINPVGSCMVSEEGTCYIFYKYRGFI
ncbi:hydrogenase formation protein HypD [Methanofervidicoccus abyssi]|uniref:Hydrogenase expression/formation protein HypD n=1 Tax=Methanofervidicoccus abyssi TaxID=2082189 RepID=A0A401HRF0_9EURY|nr:hydrogenase formation protein HypD [Methanofervidicoccus abyssi]GBF36828.1 hydrogenase expression/formation protein HypD [Methanofervidicoccus abyssi]